ncbi:GAF and ANTAR domain-containing protein [Nocardioides sp. LHG3406-4]|uniref:GAF and ANTAR domain-containing protein n=1 Tax=Nocardioides sp. LHG3406-4 TaxID=2804575 RepID=UPI003CEDF8F3
MSDRAGQFNTQLSAAVRSMQGETGTQETLDQAVTSATTIIRGCDLAGISIVHKNGIDTPSGTDEATRRIDELQYALQQGPCYDALRHRETVQSSDLRTDERWPEWGPTIARELGVLSSLSYRLFVTDDSLGAMNLYSLRTDGFDDDDVIHGLALAAHVAVAVAGAQNAEHLERAIVARTVIGQAEGILMERFGLSADKAFYTLCRISQDRNEKLSAVAERLIRTRETPQ